ncbi:bifunctional Proteasome [Babesia duncani]|uniref:Proteasome subunit beta n=1 Tax=Babesia duncani TaxID=323732 RepID=A0AAD9PK61_9APIC|nr:bifunctional Proteasome [Babesia duncani]
MSGIVTGAAIVGLKFNDGVLIAADTKLSYGRMNRVKDFCRLEKLSDNAIFCSSGDAADHQYLSETLKYQVAQELVSKNNDFSKCLINAEMLHNYLSRLQYYKRTKIEPIFSSCILAGLDAHGKPLIGYSDVYGTSYKDDFIVTGLGKYFAIGPLRQDYKPDMTKAEATELAIRCMRLLYLRDCSASDKIQVAYVTKDGVEIQDPVVITGKWDFEQFIAPTNRLPIAACQF